MHAAFRRLQMQRRLLTVSRKQVRGIATQTRLPWVIFRQAHWQGEGGSNAHGIVQGCHVVSRVLEEILGVGCAVEERSLVTASAAPPPNSLSDIPTDLGVHWYSDIAQQMTAAFEALDMVDPQRIFTAGGDCSVDLAPCSWLLQRYLGDVAVLYVDAHADLNTPAESPSGNFHGMPLRALLGESGTSGLVPRRPLRPDALLLAGLRELDPPEAAALRRLGVPSLSPNDLRAPDAGEQLTRLLQATGCSRLHVHLDLDVLEPSEFPHVSVPSPGGLSVGELRRLLRAAACALPDLVGLTVTEARPLSQADDEDCASVLRAVLGHDGLGIAAITKKP